MQHFAIINVSISLLTPFLLSACIGQIQPDVQVLQYKDKQLDCDGLVIAMTEVEHAIRISEERKRASLTDVVLPFRYIPTYVHASDAIVAAHQRQAYLNDLYHTRGCTLNRRGSSSYSISTLASNPYQM